MKNVLIIIVLMLSLGFSSNYDVNYSDSINLDGNLEEWEGMNYFYLDDSVSYIYATQDGSNLCLGFKILDSEKNDKDYFAVAFDLDEDGSYTANGDRGIALNRDGEIYALYPPWTQGEDSISSSEYSYVSQEYSSWIFKGWVGEACLSYDSLGLDKGKEKNLRIAVGYWDDKTKEWTAWPTNSLPEITVWNNFFSESNWIYSDWCSGDEGCEESEYCAPNEEEGICTLIEEEECGYIGNHSWINYECCDDSDCSEDYECIENSCVLEEVPIVCNGTISLELEYNPNTKKLNAIVEGIENCEEELVKIRKENCEGEVVCFFESEGGGGKCEFDVPTEKGIYFYVACLDLYEDGTIDSDEAGYVVEESCISFGCIPLIWEECVCEDGENSGTQTGSCVDNCGEEIELERNCNCYFDFSNFENDLELPEELQNESEENEEVLDDSEYIGEESGETQLGVEYNESSDPIINATDGPITWEESEEKEDSLYLIVGGIMIVVIILFWERYINAPKRKYKRI